MCTFAPVLYSISPKPRETDRPAKPVPCQGPKATNYKVLYDAPPRKCRQIEIDFGNLQKSSHLHPIAFEFKICYKNATATNPSQQSLGGLFMSIHVSTVFEQINTRVLSCFIHGKYGKSESSKLQKN